MKKTRALRRDIHRTIQDSAVAVAGRMGNCPSCAGRRMAAQAAHQVDRVLPAVPLYMRDDEHASNEAKEPSFAERLAELATQRGTLENVKDDTGECEGPVEPTGPLRDGAVTRHGFNLHASVTIAAGDDRALSDHDPRRVHREALRSRTARRAPTRYDFLRALGLILSLRPNAVYGRMERGDDGLDVAASSRASVGRGVRPRLRLGRREVGDTRLEHIEHGALDLSGDATERLREKELRPARVRGRARRPRGTERNALRTTSRTAAREGHCRTKAPTPRRGEASRFGIGAVYFSSAAMVTTARDFG
jgi:hypothetical protein